MVGQVGLGVEAVRAHAHAHALTKAALPVLALVCCLSGGCPVQQLQQAVHATAPHPHPPSTVLYFLPADSSWAQEWPFQFEALYTVCLMAPEPPTISDTGGSQWADNGCTGSVHTVGGGIV